MEKDPLHNTDSLGDYGLETVKMIEDRFAKGVDRGVLLMRHSAREYRRDIHDLQNPLTDSGRDLALRMGDMLAADLNMRGFASTAQRCIDTADLIIQGAVRDDNAERVKTRDTRVIEAFGVFYALDQVRMWKGLQAEDGLDSFVAKWIAGEVSTDVMMPARVAVSQILSVMKGRLMTMSPEKGRSRSLDLCVSHDMTLYLVRQAIGLETTFEQPVNYLDGLLMFETDGELRVSSHYGKEVCVDDFINT
jgi:broad specificity phosphatase PhoE